MGGTASAISSDPDTIRTVRFDTSPFSNVSEGRTRFFKDGRIAVELLGSMKEINDHRSFEVKLTDLQNDLGKYDPEGSNVIFNPTTSDSGTTTREGSAQNHTGGDIDVNDSGKDYTENHEGGIKTHCSDGYLDNSEHGHTAEWNPETWDERAYCYKGYWNHQTTKWDGLDESSDEVVSETVSQWEYGDATVQHHTKITMELDGEMEWWAQIETSGYDGWTDLDHSFNMWTSWNQCCADGDITWNSCHK